MNHGRVIKSKVIKGSFMQDAIVGISTIVVSTWSNFGRPGGSETHRANVDDDAQQHYTGRPLHWSHWLLIKE
jgi:hypothetical protein